jgi:dihydrodipicolinate synthase/N-acetylneuraminate lyase
VDFSAFRAGSYVMGVTPFDEHGRLDEDALREHVRWQSAEGINVLPASASSGEGTLLTDAEVFRTWEIVVEEAAGRFPVVAASREFPTAAENISFAREAEARGLDGIQIYPATLGHILKPTTEMLEAFYDEVLSSVNLPVLISSNESTGFEVPLALHERLIGKYDNIFGFYKNNFDFMNCATFYAEIAPRVTVLTGYLRLPMAFLLGGTGELDYLQNIAPRTCRKMHDALHTGDASSAGEAYAHIVKILAATSKFWQEEHTMRVPVYKGILRTLGRPGSFHARPPFQPLSREQEARLAKLVDELRLRELEGLD